MASPEGGQKLDMYGNVVRRDLVAQFRHTKIGCASSFLGCPWLTVNDPHRRKGSSGLKLVTVKIHNEEDLFLLKY